MNIFKEGNVRMTVKPTFTYSYISNLMTQRKHGMNNLAQKFKALSIGILVAGAACIPEVSEACTRAVYL